MNRYAALAFAGLTALSLAACQKEDTAGETPAATAKATANPADAIAATAQKLKQGDVLAVIQMSVPPKHYEKMKADWKTEINAEPVSEEDRAEFAAMMAKLTDPEAETKLFAEAEPQLAKFETEMAAQMPLMIGMGQGFAMQAIQANEKLTEAQKKQAGDVVGAVTSWLQGVQFADRTLAKQAIGKAVETARALELKAIAGSKSSAGLVDGLELERTRGLDRTLAKQAIGKAVETARALELKSIDEARALDFEPAMAKAGIAFNGMKDVLEVYGLKLDEAFDSVETQVISQAGDTAKVKVDYQIFGQPLSFETEMVQIEGRWYGKDTVDQLEKELTAPAAPDAAEGADAAAAPATNG